MLSNCDDAIDIDFSLSLLNPGGWWYQHFSVDEQVCVWVWVTERNPVAFRVCLACLWVYIQRGCLWDYIHTQGLVGLVWGIHTYTHMHAYIRTRAYTHMHACIRTRASTHMHAYIHTGLLGMSVGYKHAHKYPTTYTHKYIRIGIG